MTIAHSFIKELRITERINEELDWDKRHWLISPGGLLKMFLLSTFTDIRVPLVHLDDRLERIDTRHFLGCGEKSVFINSYNVGEAMDRLGTIDFEGLYESIALSAMVKYEIPLTRLHSDTTSLSFYGEYDAESLDLNEEEREELLKIEKGYNKDGRRGCAQVVVGQIVSEQGIPLTNRALDGATSDVEWNRIALDYLSQLQSEGFAKGIYVADSKLVVEEHIRRMNDVHKRIGFVSRCPASFQDKLEARMIAQAYARRAWRSLGQYGSAKYATSYQGIAFIEEVCGAPMRLLVLESSSLKEKAELALDKKEEAVQPLLEPLLKKRWACQADAEKDKDAFLARKELALFECSLEVECQVTQKWPRGRRGPQTQPKHEESYRLVVRGLRRREQQCQEFINGESCIVLISNVVEEEISDEEIVRIYKGQSVVENSFKELKSPRVASVIYLKNPKRIKVMTMLLTLSLLLRALIQFRLREGLKRYETEHPREVLKAGWGGRPISKPTFKLLYEHSINCYFERIKEDEYAYEWPSAEARERVEPLLMLLGTTLEQLVQ
jgi:transposase